MAKVLEVIWGSGEQKYFSENQKKDSTALETASSGSHSPLVMAGLLVPTIHLLRKTRVKIDGYAGQARV
jgi:hypothetical protein